jgi:hypothetical protein
MTLAGDELEDFKRTYENAFQVRLSDEEAHELAERLKDLYRTVLRRSAPDGAEPRPVQPPWAGNKGSAAPPGT